MVLFFFFFLLVLWEGDEVKLGAMGLVQVVNQSF